MPGPAVSRAPERSFLEVIYPVKLNPAPSQSAAATVLLVKGFFEVVLPKVSSAAGLSRSWEAMATFADTLWETPVGSLFFSPISHIWE